MLSWDVSNGLARRSWAGNSNARFTVIDEMARQPGLTVTVPSLVQEALVAAHAGHATADAAAAKSLSANSRAMAAGSIVTMITPFAADGSIDFEMVDRLTDWYVEITVAL
jgi:hypothetical protein